MKVLARFLNVSEQTITNVNDNILFNNNTFCNKYFGYNADGTIEIKIPGTYMIYANFTTIATAANGQTVRLYENGNPVPGASGTNQAAAIGDEVSVAFNAISTVKVSNTGSKALLSFKVDSITGFQVANVIIEKVY